MKIVGLILGVLLLLGGGVGTIVSLLLPSLTRNKVNLGETVVFLIPAILVFVVGFLITAAATIFILRSKKKAAY